MTRASPRLLDVARGAYARMPARARGWIGPILRVAPASLRYGATYEAWRRRIAQARRDPGEALAAQGRAAVEVVRAAHAGSAAWRAILDEALGVGFDPGALRDDAEWRRIPVLTAERVTELGEALCAVPPGSLDPCSTGGTSGRPTRFWLDRNRSPVEYAFVHEAWSRAGYRTGDARCVLRSTEIQGGAGDVRMQFDAGLAELRCSVFHLTEETMRLYAAEIRRRRIRYLHGYASAIAIFADFARRAGLADDLHLRGVFPISERLYDHSRAAIARAFPDAVIVPFYGLSEKVAFATESADAPDTYAFDPLYGRTELLDAAGEPVTRPGATGRVVSTGLLFRGMPLIRYDTGDEAELVAPPGPENGHRLTVRRIRSRKATEFLVTKAGGLVPLAGLISNADEMVALREFQFVQDVPGQATLRAVPLSDAQVDLTAYADVLTRKAGGGLVVRAEIVDALPLSPRGTRKFIDQRLDLRRFAAGAGAVEGDA